MINKLKFLLPVIMLCVSSTVYSISYQVIESRKDPELYDRISRCLPENVKTKDKPVVLLVSIDKMPYGSRFLSGKNTVLTGDICPSLLFETEEMFLRKVVELLAQDETYPLSQFNFGIVLHEGVGTTVQERSRKLLGELERLLDEVELSRKQLEQAHWAHSSQTTEGLTLLERRLQQANQQSVLCPLERDYFGSVGNYLQTRKNIFYWQIATENFQEKLPKEAGEHHQRIREHHERAQQTMERELKEYAADYNIESTFQEEERGTYRLMIRHFCDVRGRHAEDAIILKVLQDIGKMRKIPSKIEIYGTKDPCSICQVKLQHLADTLASRMARAHLGIGREKEVLKICYYSQYGYEGSCILAHLPEGSSHDDNFFTRKYQNEGALMRFSFHEGALTKEPIIFPLPKKMLTGAYIGKVLKKSSGKGNFYYVKLIRILSLNEKFVATAAIDKESELEQFYTSRSSILVKFPSDPDDILDKTVKFTVTRDNSIGPKPPGETASFCVDATFGSVI